MDDYRFFEEDDADPKFAQAEGEHDDTGRVPSVDNETDLIISVLKVSFSFFSIGLFGLFQVYFHRRQYKSERISTVVNFDSRIFETSPDAGWQEFEKRIISLISERGFNFRLSNELKRKLDENVNYKKYDDFRLALESGSEQNVRDFLHYLLTQLYGVGDVKIVLAVEHISEDAFSGRAAEEEVILVDEEGLDEDVQLRPDDTVFKGEIVLAPVFGRTMSEISVGDTIFVRVHETPVVYSPQTYKPMQQEALVKSVIHDDLSGHTILAELRPGLMVRVVESEDVKVKVHSPEGVSMVKRFVSVFLSWYFIIFALLFAGLMFLLYQ